MTKTPQTMNLSIDVVVEKDGESFHAHCPALKGLHVDGATEWDAIQNVKEAAVVYLNSLALHGDPLPICSHLVVNSVQPNPISADLFRNITVPWPILQTSGIS
jgi:predicted RNase H-like HicB family nuclease